MSILCPSSHKSKRLIYFYVKTKEDKSISSLVSASPHGSVELLELLPLGDGPLVRSESLLGHLVDLLVGRSAHNLNHIHGTLLVRSESRNFADDAANVRNALTEASLPAGGARLESALLGHVTLIESLGNT